MVTPTVTPDADESIEVLDSPDPDVDEGLPEPSEGADDTGSDQETSDSLAGDVVGTTAEAPIAEPTVAPVEPAAPQVDQRALDELYQRREMEVQQQWKDKVGRQARQYEQRLVDSGYMPEQAREQARRYIQQEQKTRQQEKEASDLVGFVEGRQAAAMHYLEKHGLANKQMIADMRALQQANTPVEMEKEAKRMKRERALMAENARLKQNRVAPQTFDNSQGAAEASTNDQRLLDAYNGGDRSEAAVRAARRLALGA